MRRIVFIRSIGAAAVLAAGALSIASAAHHRATAESVVSDPSDVSIYVNLGQRKLFLRDGGETVHEFDVAIGRDGHETPTGDYRIQKIIWNPAWIPPDSKWAEGKTPQAPGAKDNPMKLVKIFFQDPAYYIHGTNDVSSLGEAESHGCLRMDPDDAYALAKYLMDHGGQPRDESWFDRVLNFRSETKTVYLDHPVPMTVTD
jgi:lipoprotein-anchoring transpeptidase ErfK/SrfK